MAYLAMARKWRPKNFEDMVGQDHIAQTIRNAIEGQRISHAYLFTGTRGVGKTTSARILAKALNCKKGPTPTPCDDCENCKAVTNGNSMDVLEIDGASNNSVDNIRELREQVNYAPMNGKYKIYVIDEVHMLSKSAFNALLKTLEEPPAHVVFIFATTESNKVPHTILSRVQRFDFKRISENDIRGRLEYICAREEIKPEREALEAVARKADGSMRDALSLFDQVYAYSGAAFTLAAARKVLGLPRDEIFDGLLRALIAHDQKAAFTILQEAHSEGVETSELLVAFGEHLRNVLFARQGVPATSLGLSEPRRAALAASAPELRDGDLIRFAKLVSDLLASLKTTANPRLAVELGFARMAALDRMVTLSQVLGQLNEGGAAESAAGRVAAASPKAEDPEGSKKKTSLESLKGAEATREIAEARPEAGPARGVPEPGPVIEAEPQPIVETRSAVAAQAAVQVAAHATVAAHASVTAPAPASESAPWEAPSAPPWAEAAAPAPLGNLSDTETAVLPSSPATLVAEAPSALEAEDVEPDVDYPPDPEEEPSPIGLLRPPPPVEEVPPAVDVEPQDAPEALCGLWPRLVQEFTAARPFVGSNLARTRLEPDEGGLSLVFADRSAFALFGDDADFRKGMQAFLAGKLASPKGFQLKTQLDENAAAPVAGPDGRVTEPIPVPGIEGIMLREPIVKTVRDLFEGRMLNY